jgi:hypothetical protein
MDNPIDGTDGKLERGFMSADKLEEIDIGDGDKPRTIFISANLDSSFRGGLIKLLKEYKDCLHIENFTRRGIYCCYKWKIFEENIILVLKLIIDYKHQDYRHLIHRNSRRSGKKPPLEQKKS